MHLKDAEKAKRVLRSIHKFVYGEFVFHGSLARSNTLLPKRPNLRSFSNQRRTRGIRERGVYATRLVEIAALYATLPYNPQWQLVRKERYIRVLFSGEETMQISRGYLHVCRQDSFKGGGLIMRSERAAKVVRTFRVPFEVLLYLWDRKDIRFYDHMRPVRLTLPRRNASFSRP